MEDIQRQLEQGERSTMNIDRVGEFLLRLQAAHEEQDIKNGGAAMTAYARLQYEEMGDYERSGIMTGLKKYCELDTLVMVMIYEAWREWL